MQNYNFSDKFVSETRLKILILSEGMNACHRFTFSGLPPGGINYSVGWVLGCKIRKSSETKQSILGGLFACAMSQGPSLLETLMNAATTSEQKRVRSGKGNCLWKKRRNCRIRMKHGNWQDGNERFSSECAHWCRHELWDHRPAPSGWKPDPDADYVDDDDDYGYNPEFEDDDADSSVDEDDNEPV